MSVAATHDPSGHAPIFAPGGAYSLSKRTCATRAARIFSVANNNPGTDNDNLANPLRGHTQTGVNIGINHSFRRRARSELNGVNRRTA